MISLKELVWRLRQPFFQDSNYWPLTAPGNVTPSSQLTPDDVAPQVTSLWLALDPVTEENGAMEVLSFRSQPESCRNLPKEFILDSGGSTNGPFACIKSRTSNAFSVFDLSFGWHCCEVTYVSPGQTPLQMKI